MPVEIREIIIRTEIRTAGNHKPGIGEDKELKAWKKQLLEECRRITVSNKKSIKKR